LNNSILNKNAFYSSEQDNAIIEVYRVDTNGDKIYLDRNGNVSYHVNKVFIGN
jgi:hypothetical protein